MECKPCVYAQWNPVCWKSCGLIVLVNLQTVRKVQKFQVVHISCIHNHIRYMEIFQYLYITKKRRFYNVEFISFHIDYRKPYVILEVFYFLKK